VNQTPDRVHLVVFRSDGVGGVARTVANLANELVRTRPVELISLFRLRPETSYPLDPRVEQTSLLGITRRSGAPLRPRNPEARGAEPWQVELDRRPTTLGGRGAEPSGVMSEYSDHVLAEKIRSIRSGILITTRPSLHVAASRYAQPGVVLLGQDHLNFVDRSKNPAIMKALAEAVPRLDSYVVLTEDDLTDYREWAPPGSRIDRIPNGHTTPPAEQGSTLDSKVVVSAGRFVPRKGFDRLVAAWVPIAEEFPDWRLHLYGDGPEEPTIRQAIADHGLEDVVHLKGYTDSFDDVLFDSSLYAMGSTSEGFPMVLVEAMGKGVPLVAFDCPRGPADMIEDGVNGRLVPDGDLAGFSAALRELIADPARRAAMGKAGLLRARDYEMTSIAGQWEALFDELQAQGATRRERRPETDEEGAMTDSDQPERATVVVVAGSGRSGTSTIAGVLKTIGLRVPPPEVPGDATNPRGFFEPQWVVEQHSKLLRGSGARLTDARPSAFSLTESTGGRYETRHEVGTWLRSHVEPGVDLVVKDPRSSWFLPMWRQAALDADIGIAFLTMLRHPAEVVGSKDHYYKAAKVGDTPRHAQTRGAAGWINVALHTEFSTRDARRTFVRYNDLLGDWRAVVDQVSRDLGLAAAAEVSDEVAAEVDAFVDPGLRRIRTDWSEVDCPDAVRDLAQETWEQLCLLADNGGFHAEAQRRLDECRERYEEMYGDAEALAQSSIDAAAGRARREARAEARKAQRRAKPAPAAEAARPEGRRDRVRRRVRRVVPARVRRVLRRRS
jgi:glycosyltransferase involved in cell wall biosynthesis